MFSSVFSKLNNSHSFGLSLTINLILTSLLWILSSWLISLLKCHTWNRTCLAGSPLVYTSWSSYAIFIPARHRWRSFGYYSCSNRHFGPALLPTELRDIFSPSNFCYCHDWLGCQFYLCASPVLILGSLVNVMEITYLLSNIKTLISRVGNLNTSTLTLIWGE